MDEHPPAHDALSRAATLLGQAQRVMVLSGAGISTDSGIPDFRGPKGLWTKDPQAERRATIEVYMSEPEVRRGAWRSHLANAGRSPEPNAGHLAVLELERRGALEVLVTQNVDGLHLEAGHDPAKVVEIHGTTRQVRCMSCDARQPMERILERVRAGEEDPSCRERHRGAECRGILKSATISFGQSLVPEDLARAEQGALRCDLALAVGTTLAVYPAAGLVPLAQRAGAAVVIVNGEDSELDALADVVVRGSISRVLPALVERAYPS